MRLLLIEDSEEDAELMVRAARRAGFDVDHERVETAAALEQALQRPWDAIVSDFSMPRFDGLQAFKIVRRHRADVPFIFVSGVLGEERAVEAMRAGAKDYVLKNRLDRLGPVLSRELGQAADRRRKAELERALQLEERRYQTMFESAAAALLELDVSGTLELLDALPDDRREGLLVEGSDVTREAARRSRVVAANRAAMRILGADSGERLIGPLARLLRPGSGAWVAVVSALLGHDEMFQQEIQLEAVDGRKIDALLTFRVPRTIPDGKNVVISVTDVSERNSLERQMRAAQRMEAVGRLAGGVAHDFNNLLTVIGSYTSFLIESPLLAEPLVEDVQVIRDAAARAHRLTRQLLAFSRRQVAEPRILSLNQIVQEMDKLFFRLIGEDIRLVTVLDASLGVVEIDPSHVEQIIMNLAVNARDAMPGGGTLTIETANVTLDARYCAKKVSVVPPGDYVMLALSDTGSGMDEETQTRIFEPFFTTKELGKGTGLGLSTAYGIVKQFNGFIWVYSELGHGTTFKIYLPRKEGPGEPFVRKPTAPRVSRGGSETILLVEDEALVRRGAQRILREAGYDVLVASDGPRALSVCQSHPGPIHAMITDVVMPMMNGQELAERVAVIRPDVRVLYMSGYTSNAIVQQSKLNPGAVLIEKPFTLDGLLSKLRGVLEDD